MLPAVTLGNDMIKTPQSEAVTHGGDRITAIDTSGLVSFQNRLLLLLGDIASPKPSLAQFQIVFHLFFASFFHLTLTAFLAASLRSAGDNFAALAFPPFAPPASPPNRPSRTASGFFAFFIRPHYIRVALHVNPLLNRDCIREAVQVSSHHATVTSPNDYQVFRVRSTAPDSL
jgi:hypothetical protein